MIAVLLQHRPYIITAVLAVLGGWKLRQSGVNAERARPSKDKLAAVEERLEMNREATEIERRVTGMSDGEAQKDGLRWSKP